MSALQKFKEAWSHPDYPPDPVKEEEVAKLEKELGIVFPDDYRQSIISVGAICPTGDFLEWVIEQNDIVTEHNKPILKRAESIGDSEAEYYTEEEAAEYLEVMSGYINDDCEDINQFHTPDGIRQALEWIEIGMPNNLVPFASDGYGNPFAFKKEDLQNSQQTAAVYTWDHDFPEWGVQKSAESFENWVLFHLPKPDDTAPESS